MEGLFEFLDFETLDEMPDVLDNEEPTLESEGVEGHKEGEPTKEA